MSPVFWTAVDRALKAGGSLRASHAESAAEIKAIRRRYRAARDMAKSSGTTTAGPDQPSLAAHDVDCPHCRHSLTVIISVTAVEAGPTGGPNPAGPPSV